MLMPVSIIDQRKKARNRSGNVLFFLKYRAARTAVIGTEIRPDINNNPISPNLDFTRTKALLFQENFFD